MDRRAVALACPSARASQGTVVSASTLSPSSTVTRMAQVLMPARAQSASTVTCPPSPSGMGTRRTCSTVAGPVSSTQASSQMPTGTMRVSKSHL